MTFSKSFPHQILCVFVKIVVRSDVVRQSAELPVCPVPANGPRVLMWSRFFCSTCFTCLAGYSEVKIPLRSKILQSYDEKWKFIIVAGLYRSYKAHFNIILPSAYWYPSTLCYIE